ncbi:MAG: hypothetical protein U1F76_04725 [Candidatus Competibacteraceae bacterium]
MVNFLGLIGNISALLGILLFLVAGIARLGGNHYLMGYENMTLFTAGIGLLVLACLAKLYQLSNR